MTQVVTRIPELLVETIDRLVHEGAFRSRSDAVRLALEDLVGRHERAHIGKQIAEGYTRIPQNDDLKLWADRAGRAMIEGEPW